MIRRTAFALSLALAVSVLVAADKGGKDENPESLINNGLKAYKDGKISEAISQLQSAIAAMQASQQKGLTGVFPNAPDGWEAGEIDSSSGASSSGSGNFAIVTLTRNYTPKGDANGPRLTMTLTSSKELIAAQQAMVAAFKDPQTLKAMQAAGANIKTIDQDGWTGWRHSEKGQGSELTVFSKTYMLSLRVDKEDDKTLDLFWKLIDLKSIPSDKTDPAKK